MRLLYGVVGEGMGHAIRSRVVLEHLRGRGHRIKIVASGRAHTFLAKHFDDVVEIEGFELVYENNAVDRDGTALRILANVPNFALENIPAYMRDVRKYDADAVLTDFDSFAHLYGLRHRIPVISIDNQHAIPFLDHPEAILRVVQPNGDVVDHHADFDLARRIIRAKMAGCEHYLITTFFFPPIKAKFRANASLYPPILRPEVLDAAARAVTGEHVVVYQTSASYLGLLDVLAASPGTYRVYGFLRPDAPQPPGAREGDDIRFAPNVLLRAFSERGFIDDLATSRAVVTGGGFTVLGEAIYLGKPIFSVPVRRQFEQVMSARYLETMRYGEHHDEVTTDNLARFLQRAPEYALALRGHRQDGNRALLARVDELLAAIASRR